MNQEHSACNPYFLFAYFKSLFHFSCSKPPVGFAMCLVLNPPLLFLFSILLPCGSELLITVQATNIESVRKIPAVFPVRIQECFQLVFAINSALQFTQVHGWVPKHQAWHYSPQGFISSFKCASLILITCIVHYLFWCNSTHPNPYYD